MSSELIFAIGVISLIITAGTFGIFHFSKNPPPAQGSHTQPAGVAGWLLLLVVILMFLGPLSALGSVQNEIELIEATSPSLQSSDLWHNIKQAIWVLFFIRTGLTLYAGYGLSKGRTPDVVRRAIIILWVAFPGILLLNFFVVSWLIGQISLDPTFVGQLIGSALAAAIWTAYLLKSKRVNATYYPHPSSAFASKNRSDSIPDKFWAEAAKEYESGRDDALWAKSFSVSDGDEAKTKAMYIRTRAQALWNDSEMSINLNSESRYSESAEKNANLALYSLLVVILVAAYMYLQDPKSERSQAPMSVESSQLSGNTENYRQYVNPPDLMPEDYVTPPSEHKMRKDSMLFSEQTCTLYWTGTEFGQDKPDDGGQAYAMARFLIDQEPIIVGIPTYLKDLVSEDSERFINVYRLSMLKGCGFK